MNLSRITALIGIFVVVQFALAAVVRTDDLRGGLLIYLAAPSIFIVTWPVFSIVIGKVLRHRDGSKNSVLTCAGYGLALAGLSVAVMVARLFTSGPYGPGP